MPSRRLATEKKRHRLRRNSDFQKVYRQGRYFSSPEMVLYCLPWSKDQSSKVGFTVVRKLGKAVRRNRLKRRLRELTRLNSDLLPQQGCFIIVMGRPAAQDRSFAELTQIFRNLATRLHHWHKEKAGTK